MAIPFTIDFTAPGAPSNLTVTPLEQSFDFPGEPSIHRLTWLPIGTSPENLFSLEIWTTDAIGGDQRIAVFSDPAVTTFDYHFPRTNKAIQYRIFQRIRAGATITTGLFATTTATLTNRGLILASVISPVAHRINLYAIGGFVEGLLQTQEWQIPAGGQNYYEIAGSLRGRDMSWNCDLFTRYDGVTAEQHKLALETIFDAIPPETCCLRHPRGFKWFGRINGNISLPYVYGGERYTGSISFRRTSFREGT